MLNIIPSTLLRYSLTYLLSHYRKRAEKSIYFVELFMGTNQLFEWTPVGESYKPFSESGEVLGT